MNYTLYFNPIALQNSFYKHAFTRFIQASLCKIQGLSKDFPTVLRSENLYKILIYTLNFISVMLDCFIFKYLFQKIFIKVWCLYLVQHMLCCTK